MTRRFWYATRLNLCHRFLKWFGPQRAGLDGTNERTLRAPPPRPTIPLAEFIPGTRASGLWKGDLTSAFSTWALGRAPFGLTLRLKVKTLPFDFFCCGKWCWVKLGWVLLLWLTRKFLLRVREKAKSVSSSHCKECLISCMWAWVLAKRMWDSVHSYEEQVQIC